MTTRDWLQQGLISVLGVVLVLVATVLFYLVGALWPEYVTTNGQRTLQSSPVNLLFWTAQATKDPDLRLLLLVIVVGAVGSFLHAATSFVTYVGNRAFVASWLWWYLLRLPIGSATAVLFYFLLRGGLLSTNADAGDVSLFGMIAIAGLAGMFSKQASDKLGEIFDNLFRVAKGIGDDERKDKLEAVPVIESTDPASVAVANVRTVKIVGKHLPSSAKVQVGGADRVTKFVSDKEMEFTLDATDVAVAGAIEVVVVANGKRSNVLKLTVA